MRKPKRPEKKTESLDVRLPHSVKRDFMAAARARGETASAAVRRFIDGYIAETETGRSETPIKELTMTVKRNPLKSLAMAASAAMAASLFATLPSTADDHDAQPINPPHPVYPDLMIAQKIGSDCDVKLDVTAEGFPENVVPDCDHLGFIESARNAVLTLRFEPKIVNGKAVPRKNVVYPLSYHIAFEPPEEE